MDDLLTSILPAFVREGKSYLTIAMGCTGGRHRSVTLAQELATQLTRTASPSRSSTGTSTDERRGAGRAPSVVAIGGGHGTAVTLKAARRYAGLLTAWSRWPTTGGAAAGYASCSTS